MTRLFILLVICSLLLMGCKRFYEAEVYVSENQIAFSFPLNKKVSGAIFGSIDVYRHPCSADCAMWAAYRSIDSLDHKKELFEAGRIFYGQLPNGLTLRQPPQPLEIGNYQMTASVWFPFQKSSEKPGIGRQYLANFRVDYDQKGQLIISEWQPD